MPVVYILLSALFAGILIFWIPEYGAALCLGCGGGLLGLYCWKKKWRRDLLIFAAMAGMGGALTLKAQGPIVMSVTEKASYTCASSLEGIVKDLPSEKLTGKKSKIRFILNSERLLSPLTDCPNKGKLPHTENLEIQKVSGFVQVFILNPSSVPEPGDRVRIFGNFQRPNPPLNPGEMDYAAYLAANHMTVIFSGIGPAALRIKESGARLEWDAQVQRVRGRLAQRLSRSFGAGSLHAELLKALLLGLRSQFPEELWQVMMRTGTSHIVSISGLHMSVLSVFVYSLLLILVRSQKKAAVGAGAALVLYMFIAGASIPVRRAALMGAAAYAGVMAEREVQPMRLLAWVCFIQLIQNPLSIASISFQLSYLSVFILLLLRYLPPIFLVLEPFRATALVLAGTLPLAAWHFHMVSWIALIANLWAIPFFNLSLVTGAATLVLSDFPVLGRGMAELCSLCLNAGLGGLQLLSQWRSGWTTVAQPPIWKIAHYYFWGVGWFLAASLLSGKVMPFYRRTLFAGWLVAGSLFWFPVNNPSWSLTVLAGTRLPVVHLQSGSADWLINIGQGSAGGHEMKQRLLPYLKWRGIQRLEGIILTDYPKDIEFGVQRLQEEILLNKIYGPAPREGQLAGFLSKHSKVHWQRVHFTPGLKLGPLEIKTLADRGRIKLLQMTTEKGTTLFFIQQFDAESLAVVERFVDQPTILVVYGAAGGNQPEVMRLRKQLQNRMQRAVWIFSKDSPDEQAVEGEKMQKKVSYSLKKLGALQIRECREAGSLFSSERRPFRPINLQFLTGLKVTLI